MNEVMTVALQPMQQSGFDYSQLDEATAKFAWQREQEIKWEHDIMGQSAINIGKKLLDVQARLPRGYWQTWLSEGVHLSRAAAQQFMRIAHVFGDLDLRSVKTSRLALYLLSASSLPDDALKSARERLLAGGDLTLTDARTLISDFDPEMASRFRNSQYWMERRTVEAQQISSHAAEFQASVRNLQILLTEYHEPVHPKVKRAIDQLTELIAVIMDTESQQGNQPTSRQRIGARNARRPASAGSKYPGVSLWKKQNNWTARVVAPDGERIYLGRYDTEEEAARAIDAKARELYGDKARLNFPDDPA